MSASQKEREQFIVDFVHETASSGKSMAERMFDARRILRHAATHARLAEESCNGHPCQSSASMPVAEIGKLQDRWDKRIEKQEARIENLIRDICTAYTLPVTFGGDPRGFTVKLHFSSGRFNSWGGREEGYGVAS